MSAKIGHSSAHCASTSGVGGEDPRDHVAEREEHDARTPAPVGDREPDHPHARREGVVRPRWLRALWPTMIWPAIAIASRTSARKIQSWNAIW